MDGPPLLVGGPRGIPALLRPDLCRQASGGQRDRHLHPHHGGLRHRHPHRGGALRCLRRLLSVPLPVEPSGEHPLPGDGHLPPQAVYPALPLRPCLYRAGHSGSLPHHLPSGVQGGGRRLLRPLRPLHHRLSGEPPPHHPAGLHPRRAGVGAVRALPLGTPDHGRGAGRPLLGSLGHPDHAGLLPLRHPPVHQAVDRSPRGGAVHHVFRADRLRPILQAPPGSLRRHRRLGGYYTG